ncbi:magnesium and cobalt transport protein CorA [Lutibacter sp. HS1-25]|uniref:magnesium/cobalt transporter CorA n=1 Tax=Lutibacter sp. HS1-25 TaxID=2485000 RepID=UPI0010108304|nr:magnesium/cobalt transporter CorA [Lutibacter sp. HS1-25]RXP44581.1 magnesium and cobalt transport protein CorA [Lutibacter sp. HS1-25]
MRKKSLNRKKQNPTNFVFTGIQYTNEVSSQLFAYNKESHFELSNIKENEINNFSDKTKQYWLNIHGIHDVEKVSSFCEKIGIHQLTIQDILDVNQRPKFQEFEDYWFFSIKSMSPSNGDDIATEQISFVLGENFLVSFQERKNDYFEHVRHRLRSKIGILHERSVDYLLYLLLEAVLDNYFKTIETIEDKVEKFNILDINQDPSPAILNEIELYKTQLQSLKKVILPIKDFLLKIEREQFQLIQQKHVKYYFELKDLCLTLLDSCEKTENRLESLINLFFSIQGHRMNQVMKTLTVVSSIFIPLTFIAGIYGMNFVNMPELGFEWGYFAILIFMFVVFLMMLYYFKRKNWF